MASSLDRSTREAEMKKKEASKQKREEKKKETEYKKERRSARKTNKAKSAARYETHSMLRTMAISAGILIIAFIVFETLLLMWKYFLPNSVDYTREDTYWHLINIADTCIGFLIGLTAMDALTFINQNQRSRREEQRAIIRHNRIVKPSIDMYLARKNCLISADGEEYDHFKVVTKTSPRDIKDMYSPSGILSDAGKSKIDAFQFYLKKLYNAFLNMAEDINFDYNPEICEAMMKFINETTYGYAALEAVASYGKEGNKAQKMALIRKIKEIPDDMEIGSTDGELNTVLVLLHMIHAQEDALKGYLAVINEIDTESQKRTRRIF